MRREPGAGLDRKPLPGVRIREGLSTSRGRAHCSRVARELVLEGGAGSDTLSGGLEADVFNFDHSDVGLTLMTDRILDLNFAEGDTIDLSHIDANSLLADDQAFVFVSSFSKVAGQATLTYVAGTNTTTLRLEINGDGKADFAIAGDHAASGDNTFTGGGGTDGGWVL